MNPIICYQSCFTFIIKLQKLPDTITNEDREIFKTNPLADKQKAHHKANKMLVLDIYHKFTKEKRKKMNIFIRCISKYIHKVGEITETNYGKKDVKFSEYIDYYLEEDRAIYANQGFRYFNGRSKLYTKDGVLICEGEFLGGLKFGEWIYYFNNGKISERLNFLDGKINGKIIEFSYNGKK